MKKVNAKQVHGILPAGGLELKMNNACGQELDVQLIFAFHTRPQIIKLPVQMLNRLLKNSKPTTGQRVAPSLRLTRCMLTLLPMLQLSKKLRPFIKLILQEEQKLVDLLTRFTLVSALRLVTGLQLIMYKSWFSRMPRKRLYLNQPQRKVCAKKSLGT
jgi:hypothetical protein